MPRDGEGKTKGKGIGKYIAIGCLAITVLGVIGGLMAYRSCMGVISNLLGEYTDTQPRILPKITVAESEVQDIVNRVDEFKTAVAQDRPAEPLVLTSRDINVLIHSHPDWKGLAGMVHVTLTENEVRGEVSIPLNLANETMKDRYLNGSAEFTIGLTAGRLFVFINSMEVKGNPLPEEFMDHLRSENLAQEANKKEELIAVIEKLEALTVEDSRIRIVPKNSAR